MPKHIIEFNLPEEAEELETTMNASNYRSVLWDLDQDILRKYTKYGAEELVPSFEGLSADQIAAVLDWVRGQLAELISERGITL